MTTLAHYTLLTPMIAALIASLGYLFLDVEARQRWAQFFTCSGAVLAACCGTLLFGFMVWHNNPPFEITYYTWISGHTWQVEFGALVDRLTATMFLVVTVVSACVHVYSLGYMKDDPHKARFFIYLSLFTFAMLMLVSAPNLVQMFLGWEGVGVCSYLLIGFWYHKNSANAASMKAFVVNRVADAFLLLGLFTLAMTFGSLNYAEILAFVPEHTETMFVFLGYEVKVLELAALFLFIGAMGKSAQFGLHTWLPDAMEGPTPVSALIHAATMVTAGVFLLCRMSPLFEEATAVLHLVAWIGAITAIFAATVGLTQKDIKRVIAYSTCSQLGYMFFAIGVSAYPAAMFHLTTHAFFKALLFLGAGSVIHGLHHEQNLFRMGALKTALPVTYGLMWIGSLALAGIPPFAGFFSKDLILESAFGAHSNTGYALYMLGTLAALLTAFYSFRVLFLAFHGEARGDKKAHAHAHESPLVMIAPMLVLLVGAVISGFVLKAMGYLEWWQGAIFIDEAHKALENAHHSPKWVKYLPLVIALLGIAIAYVFYIRKPEIPKILAETADLPYKISLNKWYVDEAYHIMVVKPYAAISKMLWKTGDGRIIDGLGPNGISTLTYKLGEKMRGLQSGYIYHYAFAVIIGLSALLAAVLYLSATGGGH